MALGELDRFFLGDDFRTKRFYLKQEPQKEVFEWRVREDEPDGSDDLMKWDPKYGEQLDLYGALIMNGGELQHSLAYQEALNRLGSDLAKLKELYTSSRGSHIL